MTDHANATLGICKTAAALETAAFIFALATAVLAGLVAWADLRALSPVSGDPTFR